VLTQLGVQPQKIKEELIRIYDLPESFNEEMEQPMAPPTALPQEQGQGQMATTAGDVGAQGELPAQQLAQMLNQQR
jgi:hypothetical protein